MAARFCIRKSGSAFLLLANDGENEMKLGAFEYYLVVINVVGLVAFLINKLLYDHTATGQIDALLTIVSLLGGSAGIIAAILVVDSKIP